MLSLLVLGIVTSVVAYYFVQHSRTKELHRQIVQREGCQPLRCLPNKLFPPLGLDKLGKVIEAEKTRTYPLLMLGEHEKHGDTYAQWGGLTYTVITRDTENIRAMLSSDFESFEVGSGRHGCVLPLLGDGIFTQDGRKWEASRKLLAPMLQRPTLPDLKLFERHFQLLQTATVSESRVDTHPGGQTVDMKGHLLDLSLRTISEFLLGRDADLETSMPPAAGRADGFVTKLNAALDWISKRERLKIFYWVVDGLEFRRSCRAARTHVNEQVRRAMALRKKEKLEPDSSDTYVAFEPLLLKDMDPGPIRDQFMNLLLAGKDSCGSLLSWVFYALAREPQLVAALAEEIEHILGSDKSRVPDKKELNAMVQIERFICETLRLFPPVPLNGRFSIRETFLPRGGGAHGQAPVLIPKGTLIAFSTFATQRNKDLYGEDASKFRVERWNGESTKERRMIDWSYHPFLGGPRKCLGERFAITQAKYLVCRFLQHYKQLVPTDEHGDELASGSSGSWVDDVKYHVGLTMMPDAGVWLRFVLRP